MDWKERTMPLKKENVSYLRKFASLKPPCKENLLKGYITLSLHSMVMYRNSTLI